MCDLFSWIDLDGKIYFLDDNKLNTKEGRELLKLLMPMFEDDLLGHGAIRYYYPELKERGKDYEYTDFSSPDNFPDEIVEAIKSGIFRNFGVCPEILTESASGKYEKIRQPAREEYEKIVQPAWEKYNERTQPAWEKYEKIVQPAKKEYEKIRQPAFKEYEKIRQPAFENYEKRVQFTCKKTAWEEYEKVVQPVREEYEKIRNTLWEKYDKIRLPAFKDYRKIVQDIREETAKIVQPADSKYTKLVYNTFWDLVVITENRIEAWR